MCPMQPYEWNAPPGRGKCFITVEVGGEGIFRVQDTDGLIFV